ncbi:MAG: aminopeptidase P family protein [Clostridia bacterium]|nr:aminopeptidase P family protein [Clostridia bacterium]
MMIKKLQKLLKNDGKGVLILSEQNRRYFTAFPSSFGILIVTKNDAVFFTDSRYIEAAQNKIKGCDVRESKNLKEQLPAVCKELNITSLMGETCITVDELNTMRRIFKPVRITTAGTDKMISSCREIKTEYELEQIKKAQGIAERAFEHISGFIKPGITERDISLELDYFMLKNGAEALSFETIAVSGKKSSMPHGVPDSKIIENGDFITMDYGAVVNGYHSDMTRTVAVGSVSEKQKEVYSVVLEAQLAAIEKIKAGILLKDADLAARSVIEKAGYGEYFRHSTGHGVGVEIHESPNVSPKAKGRLKAGSIVTVEPGIYLPDEFGVRIEDMVYVTDTGCINLTSTKKDLIIC